MSLYQMYLNERYRLLYKSVLIFIVGVSVLIVSEGYYQISLLVFFLGLSFIAYSYMINSEVERARQVLFEKMRRSHCRLIGIKTAGNYYFVGTDGWVTRKIKRASFTNKYELYSLSPMKQSCIFFRKTASTISIRKGKSNYRFILTSKNVNSMKWNADETLEGTVSLNKNNGKWTVTYNDVDRITFTNGQMPLSFQKVFDYQHTVITFHEAYDPSLEWLLIFVWILQKDYFFSS
jgi:hypothetical protein